MPVNARLLLVIGAILFSTGGVAIKATSMTGWQVAALRSGVAAVVLLAVLPAARRGWSWRIVPVGFAYASTMALYVMSNKLTTAASAIFLQSTAPLYLLFLGPVLLKETVHRRDLWFIAALVVGMALFFVRTDTPVATAPNPLAGNVLAACAGLSWALTILGLRWLARGQESSASAPVAAVVVGNLIACAACLPWALPIEGAGAQDWMLIGYLGAFQIGAAYVFLTAGMRHVPALEASLILLVEPVLNPLWTWLVQAERPGAFTLAGGVVILGATAARTWLARRDRD